MSTKNNIPKKPEDMWLESLKTAYIYDRDRGSVSREKSGLIFKATNSADYVQVSAYLPQKGTKTFQLHHVVWFREYGEWPTQSIDHIDGNKLNNHYTNLRLVTPRENSQAYHQSRKTSSIYSGVSYKRARNKYEASIKSSGEQRYLGIFDCEIEAARAYDRALVALGEKPVNVQIIKGQQND